MSAKMSVQSVVPAKFKLAQFKLRAPTFLSAFSIKTILKIMKSFSGSRTKPIAIDFGKSSAREDRSCSNIAQRRIKEVG